MPYFLFLMICAIWGSNFMLMKQATLAFSGLQVAIGRVLGGAVVLGLIWWKQGKRPALRTTDWWTMALVVAIGYAWPYTIQPVLVSRHGGALVGMSVSFVPLLTVLLSIPFLKIIPTPREVIGVLGALVCLIAILIDTQNRAVPVRDLLLAGSVPLGYTLANICIRLRLRHISSLELSFLSLVWTACVLVPSAWFDPTPAPPPGNPIWWPLVAIVLLGTVGTGLANWMFNVLIVRQGPLFAGMVTNLVPLGAVLWGWADREQVTGLQVMALIGTMAMVALVQYGAARPAAVPARTPSPAAAD